MDGEQTMQELGSRITRRRVLQAGVVATGAIWVAPVVDSFVSKAAAASQATCTGGVCGSLPVCGPPDSECNCYTEINTGRGFCGNAISCEGASTCSDTSQCPAGWTCAESTCCPGNANVCIPPCGDDPPAGVGPTSAAA